MADSLDSSGSPMVYLSDDLLTDLMARWLEPQSIEGIANFSVLSHFDGFQRGILDSRDLIYFVSVMVFSLYLNHIAVKNARSR